MEAWHGLVGMAMGIIFCSWWTGVSSEQVGLIRLPSAIILSVEMVRLGVSWYRSLRH